MEAKGQVIDNTPIYYKDEEARKLLGEETLETEAQTCTGAINELKQSLTDYKTHSIVEQVAYDSTSTANWYVATITPATVTGYTVCGVAGYKCNKSDVYPFTFYFTGSTLQLGIRRINGDLSDTKFTVYFEYYKS